MSGIEHANKQTNSQYFIYPVVIGILKSSGFMFIKYLEVGIVNGLKTGFRVGILHCLERSSSMTKFPRPS